MTKRHWSDIEPADAVNLVLPQPGIDGPCGDDGRPCPWPWDPQQLVGASLGQYHCPYCGSMVMAGLPHPDYHQDEQTNGDDRPRDEPPAE